MLIFGHTGITLGAAALISRALGTNQSHDKRRNEPAYLSTDTIQKGQASTGFLSHMVGWADHLARIIDVRLLMVGSLLPDIIDKPLGQFFMRETFSSGRIFCHTLLFLIVTTFSGFYIFKKYKNNWMLVLSFGILTHLILDQMWRSPRTLLWPIFGLTFEREYIADWAQYILKESIIEPAVYIPEIIGAIVIIWFISIILYRRKMRLFLKKGKL